MWKGGEKKEGMTCGNGGASRVSTLKLIYIIVAPKMQLTLNLARIYI